MTRSIALALAFLVAGPVAGAAGAKPRRHHPATASTRPTPPPAHEFYPENVEGGVPGNLSFNNQIRKQTDPLSANGGR